MPKTSLVSKFSGAKAPKIDIELTPRQKMVLESEANEIFFGGAAGGGKSFLMRVAAILYCSEIPYLQAYIFRRLSPDLKTNHMDGHSGFRALLNPWVMAGFVEITDEEIRFWNGSKIHMCHCMLESDINKYQGSEINLLLIDELTHFTENIYRFLRSRNRLGTKLKDSIPDQYKNKFPLIICSSNPGNVGHAWVKKTFVDIASPMQIIQTNETEAFRRRQYVPSTFRDNPYIEEGYEHNLSGLGTEDLVRAMRDGDWDILSGAFFSNFRREKNVLHPFPIPRDWKRIVGMDWGYFFPFSIGWWAIAPENYEDPISQQAIPAGSLICYKEWYGTSGKNLGLRMDPDIVGRQLLEMQKGDPEIWCYVADPAIWKTDTGKSTGDYFRNIGIYWRKGDNSDRARGWMEIDKRINHKPLPQIYWFENCLDSIASVTNAVRSRNKPEDIDEECETHALDMARYVTLVVAKGVPMEQKETSLTNQKVLYRDLWARHFSKKNNLNYKNILIR